MSDIHEVYRRDVERYLVMCCLRGRDLYWVTAPHTEKFDPNLVIANGSDGLASELGVHYGLPMGVVTTRLLPPLHGPKAGTFQLEQCRVQLTCFSEILTWNGYPRIQENWSAIYLHTKATVLDAVAFYRPSKIVGKKRRLR